MNNQRQIVARCRQGILLLLLATAFTVQAQETANPAVNPLIYIDSARNLFDRYTTMLNSYDAQVMEFYAADAAITIWQVDVNGRPQRQAYSVNDYSSFLQRELADAKAQEIGWKFSKVTYTLENSGVRIKSKRQPKGEDYMMNFELFITPGATGLWEIKEQQVELKSLYNPPPGPKIEPLPDENEPRRRSDRRDMR